MTGAPVKIAGGPTKEFMSDTTVNWAKTEAGLCLLSDKVIRKLIRLARRELGERINQRWEQKQALGPAMQGMANFMAGVSWAMACRESLRRSKDHAPVFGVRPQSGEMWLPSELLRALRLDIKEKQWSALTAPNVMQFQAQYAAHRGRRPEPREGGAVQFRIPLARATAVGHIPIDARFDTVPK